MSAQDNIARLQESLKFFPKEEQQQIFRCVERLETVLMDYNDLTIKIAIALFCARQNERMHQ